MTKRKQTTEKPTNAYSAEQIGKVKEVGYKMASGYHQSRQMQPLTHEQKQGIRDTVDAAADLYLLVRGKDGESERLIEGLAAVVLAEARHVNRVQDPAARDYLGQLAAGYAQKAGLKPYEAPYGSAQPNLQERAGGCGPAPTPGSGYGKG